MLRVINNKRIDLTDDEFNAYQDICKAYSRENFDGKELFRDLFETNEEGIIIFLKPPTKMFSMEVVIFLQNVMLHQHLRRIYDEHNEEIKKVRELSAQLDEKLKQLDVEQPKSES